MVLYKDNTYHIIDPEVIDGIMGHWYRLEGKLYSGFELGLECPRKYMKEIDIQN